MRLFLFILGGVFIALSVFDIASEGVLAFMEDDFDHRLVSDSWGLLLPNLNDYEHILPEFVLEGYDFVQNQVSYKFFGILGGIVILLAPILFPKKIGK